MDTILIIILSVMLAFLIGLLVALSIGRRRMRQAKDKYSELEQQHAELNRVNIEQQAQLNFTKQQLDEEKQSSANRLSQSKQDLEDRLKTQQEQFDKQLQTLREQYERQLTTQQEQFDKQKAEDEAKQRRMSEEFENIANRILKDRSEEFSTQSKKQIDEVLNPLNERIKDFREQVNLAFSNETREKASLQEQLHQLMELNQTLSKDAVNLTNALKGDVKKQGNWGEFVLERVLEASGLRKGIEYEREVVVEGAEGETLRPDVIIRMPDDRQIIIDSKVSLNAYEQLSAAENEQQYQRLLKLHIESLKQHVKELYDKQYQRAGGLNTPDFVLMFVPIEASYSVALENDHSLYDYALERKIVIVSPTTLLATLHTISYVWRQENQNRNAMEIARLAGSMYDKLAGSMEDFQKVRKALENAEKALGDTYKKLSEGNGNVMRTAEKIRDLGAKTSKSLPQSQDA